MTLETMLPMDVLKYAALVSAIGFVLCAILLIGFRRGRLRTFNIYVVLSMALVAARAYAELETGDFGGWWGAVVWLNLAATAVWGVIGMARIAQSDASVYSRRLPPTDQDEP